MAAALVAVGAAVAGAVAIVRSGPGEPDPAEALERARAAMSGAGSFQLRSTGEDRSAAGEADGPGTEILYRTVTDTEVAGDDWRAVADSGDWASEVVGVDGVIYERTAGDAAALADEPWIEVPLGRPGTRDLSAEARLADVLAMLDGLDADGDGDGRIDPDVGDDLDLADSFVVRALAAYYLWGGVEAPGLPDASGVAVTLPTGLVDAFGRFGDAELVARDDDAMTIRATRRAPTEVAGAVDLVLPEGRVEVDLGRDHLPTTLRLTVDGESASYTETITFSDWGAGIAIGAPDDIDETPWIDEEALAEVQGTVTALAPTELPGDLRLVDIAALPAEVAADWGEPCDQLELWYEPPLTTQAEVDAWYAGPDHLAVYLLPVGCALVADPTPFASGPYGDVPTREAYGVVEVRIDDTVVQIDTTYTHDLPAMVASIAPFDLDAELARVAVLAKEAWLGGAVPAA